MERRSLPDGPAVETRADGKRILSGYAAVFYDPADPGSQFRLGSDGSRAVFERIFPGAFDEALRSDDVLALYNHAPDNILGRLGAGTLRLSVDSRGLRYEIDPPDSDIGRRVVEAVSRGDVAGSSFGFRAEKQSWVESPGLLVRELRSVRLRDVGPVNRGAYPSAGVALRADGPAADALADLARHRAARLRRRVAADLAAAGLPTA